MHIVQKPRPARAIFAPVFFPGFTGPTYCPRHGNTCPVAFFWPRVI